jgi:hypothetical protein
MFSKYIIELLRRICSDDKWAHFVVQIRYRCEWSDFASWVYLVIFSTYQYQRCWFRFVLFERDKLSFSRLFWLCLVAILRLKYEDFSAWRTMRIIFCRFCRHWQVESWNSRTFLLEFRRKHLRLLVCSWFLSCCCRMSTNETKHSRWHDLVSICDERQARIEISTRQLWRVSNWVCFYW